MFEMKFSLLALTIVVVLLGAGVYFSDQNGDMPRSNLKAALPPPAAVVEMRSLNDASTVLAPEVSPSEMIASPINNAIISISTQPHVEGMITEEAAFDVVEVKSVQENINEVAAVPITAQTGTGNLVWFVMGASLLTGSLGLLIAPTVVARG